MAIGARRYKYQGGRLEKLGGVLLLRRTKREPEVGGVIFSCTGCAGVFFSPSRFVLSSSLRMRTAGGSLSSETERQVEVRRVIFPCSAGCSLLFIWLFRISPSSPLQMSGLIPEGICLFHDGMEKRSSDKCLERSVFAFLNSYIVIPLRPRFLRLLHDRDTYQFRGYLHLPRRSRETESRSVIFPCTVWYTIFFFLVLISSVVSTADVQLNLRGNILLPRPNREAEV